MANNNFFDQWLKIQQRSMSDWLEATKKFQEATLEGDTEKASSAYKDWMEKQKEYAGEATETATDKNERKGSADERTTPQDLFKAQLEHFRDLVDKTGELYKDFPETDIREPKNLQELQEIQQKWFNAYRDWLNEYTEPFADLVDAFGGKEFGTGREKTEFKDVYLKFLELWAPFHKAWFDQDRNVKNIEELLDSSKLKELIDLAEDRFFPEAARLTLDMGRQWSRMMNEWGGDQWKEMRRERPLDLLDPTTWTSQTPMDLSREFIKEQHQFLFPYIRLFMAGSKGGDTIDKQFHLMHSAADHAKKIGEFQYILYQKANEGTENFLKEVHNEIEQEDVTYDSLLNIFQKWISNLEQVYLDYFKSDEYSEFQSELLNRGLEVKKRMNEITEDVLEETPLMLQRKGDRLSQRVHSLRRDVRDLKQEIDAMKTELNAVKDEKEKAQKQAAAKSTSPSSASSSRSRGKKGGSTKGSATGKKKGTKSTKGSSKTTRKKQS